jgi:hypothetical protein
MRDEKPKDLEFPESMLQWCDDALARRFLAEVRIHGLANGAYFFRVAGGELVRFEMAEERWPWIEPIREWCRGEQARLLASDTSAFAIRMAQSLGSLAMFRKIHRLVRVHTQSMSPEEAEEIARVMVLEDIRWWDGKLPRNGEDLELRKTRGALDMMGFRSDLEEIYCRVWFHGHATKYLLVHSETLRSAETEQLSFWELIEMMPPGGEGERIVKPGGPIWWLCGGAVWSVRGFQNTGEALDAVAWKIREIASAPPTEEQEGARLLDEFLRRGKAKADEVKPAPKGPGLRVIK